MDGLDPLAPGPTLALPDSPVPPLAAMRAWVRLVARDAVLERIADLLLVCTELATNAYEHGLHPMAIRLCRSASGNGILVEVHDASDKLPVLRYPPTNTVRGRGLLVVDRLCHGWGVRRRADGKTVWAEVPLS